MAESLSASYPQMILGIRSEHTALIVVDMTDSYSGLIGLPIEKIQDHRRAYRSTDFLSHQLKIQYPAIRQIWLADQTIVDEPENLFDMSREDVIPHFFVGDENVYDNIILKDNWDGFKGHECETGKSLDDLLKAHQIRNLLICGQAITQCVRMTAYSGVKAGYHTYCISECVTGGYDIKRLALEELSEGGVIVQSLSGILTQLGIDQQPLIDLTRKEENIVNRRNFLTGYWQPLEPTA